MCVDVSDLEAVRAAVETMGPVHLLVNNAGVGMLQPFLDVTPETFDRCIYFEVLSHGLSRNPRKRS